MEGKSCGCTTARVGSEKNEKINYIRTNEIKITNIIEYATPTERGRKQENIFLVEIGIKKFLQCPILRCRKLVEISFEKCM